MAWFNKLFKPSKQRLFRGKIYGFDIETYNRNKSFLCATVYYDKNNFWTFEDKRKLIEFFKTKRFKNSIVVATNLGFDFNGTFFNEPEIKQFGFLYRGSSLIYAKSNIRNKEFHKIATKMETVEIDGKKITRRKKGIQQGQSITFLDTLNYALLSVEQLGNILNIPKLKSPSFIGRKPKNKKEHDEMITYNIRDSEISKLFLEFFYDSVSKLGASHKLTIASTSMSLYKNKYLKDNYWRHNISELLEIFKAYYGGRTEAFSRGRIEEYNYYDFNSLYPDVMRKKYPNPNSKRITYKNNLDYINKYDGVSDIEIYCPKMKYPLLPYRDEEKKKLLFPIGNFRGWYSHIELREAIRLGYQIKKVYKTYYYKDKCIPFKKYVTDLYKLRDDFKKQKNSMEYVVKILMNSLYGKFGQKFQDRDEIQPFNHTIEELNQLKDFERIGDFIRIKKDYDEPSPFCIPIWAIYVTAYARLKLHKALVETDAVYCDTDSIITKKIMSTSNELGALKLEMKIKNGFIVKPKFYAVVDKNNNEFVKIKGLGRRLTYQEFNQFLKSPKLVYKKFMKFKEAIRRDFIPNEIIDMTKEMDLEDNKRVWIGDFNSKTLNTSIPIEL